MTKVVYADALFLFNFAVVLSLLRLTAHLAKIKYAVWRLGLAAVFGGVLSVFSALYQVGGLAGFFIKVLSLAFSVVIAFQGHPRKLIKLFSLLAALTFSIGGGLYMVFLFSGNSNIIFYGNEFYIDISLPLFLFVFALLYVLSGAVFKVFSRGKNVSRKVLNAQIMYRGKVYHADVLSDTGSTLKEPLTGLDVLVLERSVLQIDKSNAEYVVPYRTFSGEGVLYAVRPVFVRLLDGKEELILRRILVATAEGKVSKDGEFKGILPSEALLKV